MITSISFLMMGGALALAIRAELFLPGQQIFSNANDFERFFTGTWNYNAIVVGYSFWSWCRELSYSHHGPIQRHGMAKAERCSVLDDPCSCLR